MLPAWPEPVGGRAFKRRDFCRSYLFRHEAYSVHLASSAGDVLTCLNHDCRAAPFRLVRVRRIPLLNEVFKRRECDSGQRFNVNASERANGGNCSS